MSRLAQNPFLHAPRPWGVTTIYHAENQNNGPYVFPDADLGPVSANRKLFVFAFTSGSGSPRVSSLTVGGQSTTLLQESTLVSASQSCSVSVVDVDPGGTTAEILLAYTGTATRVGICVVSAEDVDIIDTRKNTSQEIKDLVTKVGGQALVYAGWLTYDYRGDWFGISANPFDVDIESGVMHSIGWNSGTPESAGFTIGPDVIANTEIVAVALNKAAAAGGINGDLSVIEAGDVAVAAGALDLRADAAIALEPDSVAAAAALRIVGAAAIGGDGDSLAATGSSETLPGIFGDLSTTEADDLAAAAGALDLRADAAIALEPDSVVAGAALRIVGAAVMVGEGDSLAATGSSVTLPEIVGGLDVLEGGDLLAATGSSEALQEIIADLAAVNDNDVLASACTMTSILEFDVSARARSDFSAIAPGPLVFIARV